MRIPTVLIVGALLIAPANAKTDPTQEVSRECDDIEFLRDEIQTLRAIIKNAQALKLAPGYIKMQEEKEQVLAERDRRCPGRNQRRNTKS